MTAAGIAGDHLTKPMPLMPHTKPPACPTCLVEGSCCHQQHRHIDHQGQAQCSSNVQEVVQAQLGQAGACTCSCLARHQRTARGGGGEQRGQQCVAELVVVMVWLYARVGVTVTSAVTNQSLCHRVRNTPSPAC